jgi:cytoskeletal protein CcmA (bactofilin family)
LSLPSDTSALLDRHASLTGTVAGHDLVVMGSLDGDLRLTGRLHLAPGSRLRARVQASVVELEGDFEGEVRAETLRVSASARARGVFLAERLSIQEGAVLEGSVQAPAVAEERTLAAVPVAAPQSAPASTTPAAANDDVADDEAPAATEEETTAPPA